MAGDHFTGCCRERLLPPDRGTDIPGTIDRTFAVIGRGRDLPALEQLGFVEIIARGPSIREDRTYALFRVAPGEDDRSPSREVETLGGSPGRSLIRFR